jgi:hypothetical protein
MCHNVACHAITRRAARRVLSSGPICMATQVHALGITYRPGNNRGYVVVRFTLEGDKVVSRELESPEAEPIHFAAARLRAGCAALLQAAREDAEVLSASKVRPNATPPKTP